MQPVGCPRAGTAHFRSISMFSLRPLLSTEIMMPKPLTIATPIKVHATPILCRIPNFQSAARRPPTRTAKPRRYIPAHFMTNLPIHDEPLDKMWPQDVAAAGCSRAAQTYPHTPFFNWPALLEVGCQRLQRRHAGPAADMRSVAEFVSNPDTHRAWSLDLIRPLPAPSLCLPGHLRFLPSTISPLRRAASTASCCIRAIRSDPSSP